MRLIDADALFREIELLDPEFGNDNSSFVEQGDVLDAIYSAPTVVAYTEEFWQKEVSK